MWDRHSVVQVTLRNWSRHPMAEEGGQDSRSSWRSNHMVRVVNLHPRYDLLFFVMCYVKEFRWTLRKVLILRRINHNLCRTHPSSFESSTRKSYHIPAIGAVARCQSECASIIRYQGGKSKSSSIIAAIMSITHHNGLGIHRFVLEVAE